MGDSDSHTSPQSQSSTQLLLSPLWKVVVLNDPVNLMSYVVLVFRKVLGISLEAASKHMMEVHEQGRSVVWVGVREKAEAYAYSLQQWHLTVILEKDEAH